MKVFLFVFFVTATFVFIPGVAQSAVTGSQCQSHLAQVTDLLKRENLSSYWKINDEITNVLGVSLNEITRTRSQDPVVEDFVNSVKTTIDECQAHCGGITDKDGKKLSCKELEHKTILDVNLAIKNIDGNLVVESAGERAPEPPLSNEDNPLSGSPCDGGIQTDSCQVHLRELEEQRKRMTIEATLTASIVECARQEERTDTCQTLLDELSDLLESSENATSGEECLLGEDCGDRSVL